MKVRAKMSIETLVVQGEWYVVANTIIKDGPVVDCVQKYYSLVGKGWYLADNFQTLDELRSEKLDKLIDNN